MTNSNSGECSVPSPSAASRGGGRSSSLRGIDKMLVRLAKRRTETLIRGHIRLEDMLALAFIRGIEAVREAKEQTNEVDA